ncbi:DUF2695 domain-containing protein [Pelomonas baiyunensis]|uniref:DUF2695 domain-containing protein n=1 Tax=Pelomonas baiyunensis TaxID=3299026 RepID=A0ABW7GY59_9BURK
MNTTDQDRKKAWKIQQKQLARDAFPIADGLLESLFDAVDAGVEQSGCDHSLRFTTSWLLERRQPKDKVLSWLREHGGFCDCEVLANAADHWEQSR